jgi:hypothetical protein
VSRSHLLFHPLGELFIQKSRADVSQPGLGHLRELQGRLRQVLVHLSVIVVEELADLFHTQAFILWDMNRPDHRRSQHLLLAAHEFLEVYKKEIRSATPALEEWSLTVDRYVVVWGQEDADIGRQEVCKDHDIISDVEEIGWH